MSAHNLFSRPYSALTADDPKRRVRGANGKWTAPKRKRPRNGRPAGAAAASSARAVPMLLPPPPTVLAGASPPAGAPFLVPFPLPARTATVPPNLARPRTALPYSALTAGDPKRRVRGANGEWTATKRRAGTKGRPTDTASAVPPTRTAPLLLPPPPPVVVAVAVACYPPRPRPAFAAAIPFPAGMMAAVAPSRLIRPYTALTAGAPNRRLKLGGRDGRPRHKDRDVVAKEAAGGAAEKCRGDAAAAEHPPVLVAAARDVSVAVAEATLQAPGAPPPPVGPPPRSAVEAAPRAGCLAAAPRLVGGPDAAWEAGGSCKGGACGPDGRPQNDDSGGDVTAAVVGKEDSVAKDGRGEQQPAVGKDDAAAKGGYDERSAASVATAVAPGSCKRESCGPHQRLPQNADEEDDHVEKSSVRKYDAAEKASGDRQMVGKDHVVANDDGKGAAAGKVNVAANSEREGAAAGKGDAVTKDSGEQAAVRTGDAAAKSVDGKRDVAETGDDSTATGDIERAVAGKGDDAAAKAVCGERSAFAASPSLMLAPAGESPPILGLATATSTRRWIPGAFQLPAVPLPRVPPPTIMAPTLAAPYSALMAGASKRRRKRGRDERPHETAPALAQTRNPNAATAQASATAAAVHGIMPSSRAGRGCPPGYNPYAQYRLMSVMVPAPVPPRMPPPSVNRPPPMLVPPVGPRRYIPSASNAEEEEEDRKKGPRAEAEEVLRSFWEGRRERRRRQRANGVDGAKADGSEAGGGAGVATEPAAASGGVDGEAVVESEARVVHAATEPAAGDEGAKGVKRRDRLEEDDKENTAAPPSSSSDAVRAAEAMAAIERGLRENLEPEAVRRAAAERLQHIRRSRLFLARPSALELVERHAAAVASERASADLRAWTFRCGNHLVSGGTGVAFVSDAVAAVGARNAAAVRPASATATAKEAASAGCGIPGKGRPSLSYGSSDSAGDGSDADGGGDEARNDNGDAVAVTDPRVAGSDRDDAAEKSREEDDERREMEAEKVAVDLLSDATNVHDAAWRALGEAQIALRAAEAAAERAAEDEDRARLWAWLESGGRRAGVGVAPKRQETGGTTASGGTDARAERAVMIPTPREEEERLARQQKLEEKEDRLWDNAAAARAESDNECEAAVPEEEDGSARTEKAEAKEATTETETAAVREDEEVDEDAIFAAADDEGSITTNDDCDGGAAEERARPESNTATMAVDVETEAEVGAATRSAAESPLKGESGAEESPAGVLNLEAFRQKWNIPDKGKGSGPRGSQGMQRDRVRKARSWPSDVVSAQWMAKYDALKAIADDEGTSDIIRTKKDVGSKRGKLYEWIILHRTYYPFYIKLVEESEGWASGIMNDCRAEKGGGSNKEDAAAGGRTLALRAAAEERFASLRKRTGGLSPTKVALLEALPGWTWSKRNPNAWRDQFDELVRYKAMFGNCLVKPDWNARGRPCGLYTWAFNQRKHYKLYRRGENCTLYPEGKKRRRKGSGGTLLSSLTPERIRLLSGLGFAWDVKDDMWNRKFDELAAYKNQFGTCHVPRRYKTPGSDTCLGSWCQQMRFMYRDTMEGRRVAEGSYLTRERMKLLDEFGFPWVVQASKFVSKKRMTATVDDVQVVDEGGGEDTQEEEQIDDDEGAEEEADVPEESDSDEGQSESEEAGASSDNDAAAESEQEEENAENDGWSKYTIRSESVSLV